MAHEFDIPDDDGSAFDCALKEMQRLEAELEVLKANSIADIATMNCRKSKIEQLESQLAAAAERERVLKEELEVCRRLDDTFWDALKPLGLKEIYLSCPGQHVVDLITERDKLKERERVLVESLKEIATWSEKLNTDALSDIKIAMAQWRGCVAIATNALAQVKGEVDG